MPDTPSPTRQPRRRRRRLLLLLIALALLATLVALAPTILSSWPCRDWILAYAGDRLGADARVDTLRLGWFSDQSVSGLTLTDSDGQPLLKVTRLTFDQGLVSLAWHSNRLGPVIVDGAEVWPQQLLRAYEHRAETSPPSPEPEPTSTEPPAAAPPLTLPESVRIANLTLHGPTGQVRVTQAAFRIDADQAAGHVDLEVEAADTRGNAAVDLTVAGLADPAASPTVAAQGRFADLAVGAILDLLSTSPNRLSGGGMLTGTFDASRGADGRLVVRATCDGRDLWATGSLLCGDRPALDALHLEADVDYGAGAVDVRRFALSSAVAEADASGTFALPADAAQPPTGRGTGHLRVALAPLARMLPHTLRLHDDMTVSGGTLTASAEATSDGHALHVLASADLKDLGGRRGDRAVSLDPVHFQADVSQATGGPLTAQSLALTGPFGTLSARGSLASCTLDADLALQEATDQVGRFVDLGPYTAAGTARLHAETSAAADGATRVTATVDLANFLVRLAADRQWQEPHATLTADAAFRFDADDRLAAASVTSLTATSAAGSLQAAGSAERRADAWSFQGDAQGAGDLASLARLIRVCLDRQGDPITGRWTFKAHAAGSTADAANVTLTARATEVALPTTAGSTATPLAPVDLRADVRYTLASPPVLTLNTFVVQGPGLSVSASGSLALPLASDAGATGSTAALPGKSELKASADLATLASLAAPFGLLPEGFHMAGIADLALRTDPAKDAALPLALTAWVRNLDLAWANGRRLREAKVATTLDGRLLLNAAGAPTGLDLASWFVEGAAGHLGGTAAIRRTDDTGDWTLDATYAGTGAVGSLAETVAGLLATAPGSVTGTWKADGRIASSAAEGLRVELAAQSTGLAVPQSDAAAATPLPDVHLDASLTRTPAGAFDVRRLDLSGPGLTLKAAGTLHPAVADGATSAPADGTVALAVDLAPLAEALRPFGLLAPGSRMAGRAAFDGKVASTARGLEGSGTLDLTALDVYLADSQFTLQEPTAHVPLTFAQVAQDRRWQVDLRGIQSALVRGNAGGSFTLADDRITLDTRCDLTCDGERLAAVLGPHLPDDLRLTKTWRIVADLRGPWTRGEGEWNQKVARLTSDATFESGAFDYRGLSGEGGKIRARLADGLLVLAADPKTPSRIPVNNGAVTLGGRMDLRPSPAAYDLAEHLVAADRIVLNEQIVRKFLKFTSPILAVSVKPGGLLSVSLDEVHVDLASGHGPQARLRGQVWIEKFQAELSGPLGDLVQRSGNPTQLPEQNLGPFALDLRDGYFRIDHQKTRLSESVSLDLDGRIGIDGSLDVTVSMPLTTKLLKHFGVSEKAMPLLEGQSIEVPLRGTVDRPTLNEKSLAASVVRMGLEVLRRKAAEDIGKWIEGAIEKREKK